jgi:hypothetical protein
MAIIVSQYEIENLDEDCQLVVTKHGVDDVGRDCHYVSEQEIYDYYRFNFCDGLTHYESFSQWLDDFYPNGAGWYLDYPSEFICK